MQTLSELTSTFLKDFQQENLLLHDQTPPQEPAGLLWPAGLSSGTSAHVASTAAHKNSQSERRQGKALIEKDKPAACVKLCFLLTKAK